MSNVPIDDWELSARCSKHNHPFAPCPYCQIENKDSLIDKLTVLAEQLTAENERLTDLLQQIYVWAAAYPLQVFPEPDFKKAATVLKENGLTLDAISASNMRHVLSGILRITGQVIDKNEEKS